MSDAASLSALWWAVIASGLYHGLNPGMGWPLAVSAALMEQRSAALARALAALAGGHLLSMLIVLLPFAAMTALARYEWEIRVGAAVLVIALGVYLFVTNRHPRFLARISPTKLALWSFLAAIAHGAGLMIVPIYLGICKVDSAGHVAAEGLMTGTLGTALLVAFAHTAAMAIAGSVLAVAVYYWLGLKALTLSWFNLDRVWAASLVIVGVAAIALGHRSA